MSQLTLGIVGLGFGWEFVSPFQPLQLSRRRQLKRLLGLERDAVAPDQDLSAIKRLVVCDADADRIEAFRREFPIIAAGYSNIGRMLEKETPDAVCIVTPDHLHRPHAEQCFASGCHVLLTKPIACNLEDARAIIHAAEAANRTLMVAQERRFRTRNRVVKQMLEAGDLGEVVHLRSDITQDKQEWFRQKPWYATPEAGRSAITGTGIHEVDLIRHLIGSEIESVAAFGNRLGELEFPKDKTTAALFRFHNGAIGQVTVTYVAKPKKGRNHAGSFVLTGTKGAVVDNRVARNGREEWEELPQESGFGVKGCVREFIHSVVNGTKPPVTGRDAFASLAACVAADESSATGRVVQPESCD
jgi:predicted dehydrogenase